MAQLIDAIHTLCGQIIGHDELQEADQLLCSFVDDFEVAYGESKMVFNVHLLRHLADSVRSIGPLHAYSNYHFEDHIGHLVSFHKGTTDVASQICEKYSLEKNMFYHLARSRMAQEFYDEISCNRMLKHSRKIAGSVLLGKPKKLSKLAERDRILISSQLNIPYDFELQEFGAILLNSKVFYECISYSEKHTSDSFIFNAQSTQFALIQSIFVIDDNVHLLINENFEVKFDASIKCKSHIQLNELAVDCKKIIDPASVGPKFAFIKFENSVSCSKFPNMIERN